ncbi:anti-phage dCTP deaminase [Rhizobium sp. S152]|uniref:anti-phage dCTP deaminase n=1 Tax=Rhizobium sp. S152 TaxID=3055038 RepID=UPI0025AA0AB0|nr:anti-phage dCTP deaminase [Rhizobium sp. S152]MDM9628359.1 anti-phage dCTP deaminase [Rhizobium sp. S152]
MASAELVIGLVGHAGSGCTSISTALYAALLASGYQVHQIKLSGIIEARLPAGALPQIRSTPEFKGIDQLKRARVLQDAGDGIRENQEYILASLAIEKIRELRGDAPVGGKKIAYLLDSLKNVAEVQLLRDVYGSTFRLVAVHCDYDRRFKRLFGQIGADAKFAGAPLQDVIDFMSRDEMDKSRNGQQVREVFHLADYFVDDNKDEKINIQNNANLKRFCEILLGSGFHRPTAEETAMYTAFSAALRSSCLSRQVGAALASEHGQIISIGSNDVPKYGGGTYVEGSKPDCRCAVWEWSSIDGKLNFQGCHNSRHKKLIAEEIRDAVVSQITAGISTASKSLSESEHKVVAKAIAAYLGNAPVDLNIPRIKDLVEYSRSIHAEMDAIFSAARQGTSTRNTMLFCTTFPCHNCARHLVTAGVKQVFYVEPYVKSLAIDLHSDSIRTSNSAEAEKQTHMLILPFTGVGPRMYEDHFIKSGELKDENGAFTPPTGTRPVMGARIGALETIEKQAVELINK